MRDLKFLILLLITVPLFSQSMLNNKVTEFGILSYPDSTGKPAAIPEDRPKMDSNQDVEVLKIFAPEDQKFEIDSTKNASITGKKGVRFFIPALSLKNEQGEILKETVEVYVTEVIDSIDYAAAGIGLTYYDRGGKEQYLYSAGMFRIEFKKNGNKLVFDANKSIEVHFPEFKDSEKYNLFQLKDGNWNLKAALNRDSEETSAKTKSADKVGVRIIHIDNSGWWNFAVGKTDVACLKGEIEFPEGVKLKGTRVISLGTDHRSYFNTTVSGTSFKILAHKSKAAKVLVYDEAGYIGYADIAKTSDKTGQLTGDESSTNSRQDIGKIVLKKITNENKKSADVFRTFLGFISRPYKIEYVK